jgi:GT2 family glycosyltransferase
VTAPGAPGAPDLSVVVVSFNTRALLADCLTSVFASRGPVLDVWVVDNASSDGSVEMVSRDFPVAKLIANAENLGFARANNQAIERATGRYVLLLNSDTRVLDDALARLVAFLDQHPEAGACGPQLLNADASLQRSGRAFPGLGAAALALVPLPGALRTALASPSERRDHGAIASVDDLTGAALCVRRAALDQVGALDPGFFFFGEDVDLCWRLAHAGWARYYVPEARVVHLLAGSHARRSDRIRHLTQRAYVRLLRKHRPGWRAETLAALAAALTLMRAGFGVAGRWLRADRAGAAETWGAAREQLAWLASPAARP